MNEPVSELGELIRDTRKKAGLNQAELADLIGRKQQAVSRWESGLIMPTVVALKSLAKALHPHVTVDQLLQAAAMSTEATFKIDTDYVRELESRVAQLETLVRESVAAKGSSTVSRRAGGVKKAPQAAVSAARPRARAAKR